MTKHKVLAVDLIVAARPNFVKAAAVWHAMAGRRDLRARLIHTGQHYAPELSERIIGELGLPTPDLNLAVGSGSNREQVTKTMLKLEPILSADRPDWVVIFGDVNATVAAALVANKLGLPLAHVESGLRSFDPTMPEERNRIVADAASQLLLTSSPEAKTNLAREGVAGRVVFVGNTMIDSLRRNESAASRLGIPQRLGVPEDGYALVTLHRPSNVDSQEALVRLVNALGWIQQRLPVVFPVHPRTRKQLTEFGLDAALASMPGVRVIDPCSYLEFLSLMQTAQMVLTDSGGVQEETTCLGIPCVTLRDNTERPITVTQGTNELVGSDPDRLRAAVVRILEGRWKTGTVPEKWDGQAGTRVIEALRLTVGRVKSPAGELLTARAMP